MMSAVLQNGIRCQTMLPIEIVTEVNKVINQNQLTCEIAAIKHRRLQHRLNSKFGTDGKQLRFYRRRDLRFIFQSAEDIVWYYWKTLENEVPHFEILLAAQNYVKASLEALVDCVTNLHAGPPSLTKSTSSTSSESNETAKGRVSVNDSYDSIELQFFIPAVSFSDTVTCHRI